MKSVSTTFKALSTIWLAAPVLLYLEVKLQPYFSGGVGWRFYYLIFPTTLGMYLMGWLGGGLGLNWMSRKV